MSFSEFRSKFDELELTSVGGNTKRRTKLIGLITLASLFFFVVLSTTISLASGPNPSRFVLPKVTNDDGSELTKPKGLKIVAFVFYGRRDRIQILECYLRRNLAENGGWLDEVQWVANTDKVEDLEYLDKIVLPSHQNYRKITLHDLGFNTGFSSMWETVERGVLYVKIDDDVLYIADDTIPRIVTTKLTHPEFYLVSANMINNPLMGWTHYKLGAVHPYLPEYEGDLHDKDKENNEDDDDDLDGERDVKKSVESRSNSVHLPPPTWHVSQLPVWKGPDNYTISIDAKPFERHHRWLPVRNDRRARLLQKTPISEIEYKTWGTGINNWPIAAQEHYSFFENLEKNNLEIYKAGKIWFADYQRTSINLIAIWGDDVLDNLPMTTVDEEWLTKEVPKALGKSTVIDMQALAVHFAFGPQKKGIESTDLLQRYLSYANERICLR